MNKFLAITCAREIFKFQSELWVMGMDEINVLKETKLRFQGYREVSDEMYDMHIEGKVSEPTQPDLPKQMDENQVRIDLQELCEKHNIIIEGDRDDPFFITNKDDPHDVFGIYSIGDE